jgi:hypothetical protein
MYPDVNSTTYIYNPYNPVKTLGGNNLALACGPLDQQTVPFPHSRPYCSVPCASSVATTID